MQATINLDFYSKWTKNLWGGVGLKPLPRPRYTLCVFISASVRKCDKVYILEENCCR